MPSEDYPGFAWLSEHWDELADFNFQWVAVNENGPLAHDVELVTVMQSVIEQGKQGRAVYAFVDFSEFEISR